MSLWNRCDACWCGYEHEWHDTRWCHFFQGTRVDVIWMSHLHSADLMHVDVTLECDCELEWHDTRWCYDEGTRDVLTTYGRVMLIVTDVDESCAYTHVHRVMFIMTWVMSILSHVDSDRCGWVMFILPRVMFIVTWVFLIVTGEDESCWYWHESCSWRHVLCW